MNDQSGPTRSTSGQPVIVGVTSKQPESVLITAAEFAGRLGTELICASVDPGRYLVNDNIDGFVTALPFDPDLPELGEEVFDSGLVERIGIVLRGRPVTWSVRALAGEPARALSHLADTLDAQLIVIGTREPGFRAEIKEFLAGSIAVHLAHRQHRPVLVVPLAPVTDDGALPWEAG